MMMKQRILYGLLLLLCVAQFSCVKEDIVSEQGEQPYAEGELLVKFTSDVADMIAEVEPTRSGKTTRSGNPSVDEVMELIGTYDLERVFPYDEEREELTRKSGLHQWYVVRFGGEYTAEQVAEQLIRPTGLLDPEVEVRPIEGQVDDLLGEIRERVAKSERVLVTTLTKKMAEDLTDYLEQNGVRVRYIHFNVETMERMEIIRDLRMGVFDVLVGINLLREGLDLPEVSLVAILDADKEGFLRGETSLIQTIGRAARNASGKVIMYGDTITGSMQRAITETARRRAKQDAFNRANGIVPRTVVKDIRDVIDMASPTGGKQGSRAEQAAKGKMPAKQKDKLIAELTTEMRQAAAKLEFEKAAYLRDQIKRIQGGDKYETE